MVEVKTVSVPGNVRINDGYGSGAIIWEEDRQKISVKDVELDSLSDEELVSLQIKIRKARRDKEQDEVDKAWRCLEGLFGENFSDRRRVGYTANVYREYTDLQKILTVLRKVIKNDLEIEKWFKKQRLKTCWVKIYQHGSGFNFKVVLSLDCCVLDKKNVEWLESSFCWLSIEKGDFTMELQSDMSFKDLEGR